MDSKIDWQNLQLGNLPVAVRRNSEHERAWFPYRGSRSFLNLTATRKVLHLCSSRSFHCPVFVEGNRVNRFNEDLTIRAFPG
jgi:hypothetical protein